MSEVQIPGMLIFLSNGKDIELPENSFLDAIHELGQQGWELVGIINWSDEGFQVPTENLIPRSSYFISALLKTDSPHGVYVQQTGRITAQLGFVFKRQLSLPVE